jgi:hypothetical protein
MCSNSFKGDRKTHGDFPSLNLQEHQCNSLEDQNCQSNCFHYTSVKFKLLSGTIVPDLELQGNSRERRYRIHEKLNILMYSLKSLSI